mmetsp:Transcript_112563/g.157872  ORF Transcript_112563/g.157872 Transcript_112563/m.157872 type:complete len:210 (-) Transcript_112563:42-671(-)
MRKHNGNLDSNNSLAKHDVADGGVNVVADRVTGLDHVSVAELHGLGTLGAELARDNELTALGLVLHDVPQHTIAGTADGKSSEKLVAEGLGLGDGAEATVVDALSEELDRVLGEGEALLHDGGELPDAAALVAKHVLGAGGADDDRRLVGRHAHLDAGVALLGQLVGEQGVELGVEEAIGHELALLADLCGHGVYRELCDAANCCRCGF